MADRPAHLSDLTDFQLEVQLVRSSIELELLRRELLARKSPSASHWIHLACECSRRASLKFTRTPDPIGFPRWLWRNIRLLYA